MPTPWLLRYGPSPSFHTLLVWGDFPNYPADIHDTGVCWMLHYGPWKAIHDTKVWWMLIAALRWHSFCSLHKICQSLSFQVVSIDVPWKLKQWHSISFQLGRYMLHLLLPIFYCIAVKPHLCSSNSVQSTFHLLVFNSLWILNSSSYYYKVRIMPFKPILAIIENVALFPKSAILKLFKVKDPMLASLQILFPFVLLS